MVAADTLLTALQHADALFPSGGFAFSWGLEGLALDDRIGRADLAPYLEGQLRHRWAELDRPLTAIAHALAGRLEEALDLDRWTDALAIVRPQRDGSRRTGAALLSIYAGLGIPGAAAYRERVLAGQAPGHAPVVLGIVLAGAGLAVRPALAVAAYAITASLAAAAIRLGLAGHVDAQGALSRAGPLIAELVRRPIPDRRDIATFAPASDIAMMRHATRDFRLFSN